MHMRELSFQPVFKQKLCRRPWWPIRKLYGTNKITRLWPNINHVSESEPSSGRSVGRLLIICTNNPSRRSDESMKQQTDAHSEINLKHIVASSLNAFYLASPKPRVPSQPSHHHQTQTHSQTESGHRELKVEELCRANDFTHLTLSVLRAKVINTDSLARSYI